MNTFVKRIQCVCLVALVCLAAASLTTATYVEVTQSSGGELAAARIEIKRLNALLSEMGASQPKGSESLAESRLGEEPKGNHTKHDDEEADELKENKIRLYVAMIVITAIIAISIGFEITKDVLEEATREAMKPILRNIFGELTILGFIGLVMFLVTKYGKRYLDIFANHNKDKGWFSDECTQFKGELVCPENPLIELTETVHMVLFMVMMLFLGSAVLLVKIGQKKEKRWRFLEDYTLTTPLELIKRNAVAAEIKRSKQNWCSRLFTKNHEVRDWHERLRYAALRIGFIHTANKNIEEPDDGKGVNEHKIQMDFDFAEYIDHEFTKVLVEIVDITPTNWFFIWVMFMIFLVIDLGDLDTHSETMAITYAAMIAAYLSSFFLIYLNRHIKFVEGQLIHHEHEYQLEHEAAKSMSINDMESNVLPLLDEHHLDVEVTHHPAYRYHQDGTEKPKRREEPDWSHHFSLFWGGPKGLAILFGYIRVELVMISVYLGCFIVSLGPAVWQNFVNPGHGGEEKGLMLGEGGEGGTPPNNYFAAIVVYVVAFIPVLVHIEEYAQVLPNLSIVTSVEEMIESKGILRTLRIMKSRNAMLALHNMSCFMHCVDRLTKQMKNEVKKFDCFRGLSTSVFMKLINDVQIKHFHAGRPILKAGEQNSYTFVIVSGEVEMLDAAGTSVGEFCSGEDFGEVSMLSSNICKCSAVPRSPTVVLMLTRDEFMTYIAPCRAESTQSSKDGDSELERAIKARDRHNHEKLRTPTPLNHKTVHNKHKDRLPEALKFYRRVALSKIFKTIDESGDGSVDQEELETFLSSLFPTSNESEGYKKQLTVMIQALDEDGGGDVDENEFLSMMEPIVADEEERETLENMAERMFEILDDDGSECLTTSEFKESLEKLGVKMSYEEIRELFHEYDEDLDGVLDAEEFVSLMTHQV